METLPQLPSFLTVSGHSYDNCFIASTALANRSPLVSSAVGFDIHPFGEDAYVRSVAPLGTPTPLSCAD
jgi:hypothetical protein